MGQGRAATLVHFNPVGRRFSRETGRTHCVKETSTGGMSAAMLALVCGNRQVVAAQLRPALSRGTATTACSKPLSAEHWGKNSSQAQTACFAHVARTRQPHPSSRATRGGGGGGGREWVPCSVSGTGGRDGDGDGLDADGLEKKTATITTEKFAGPIREMLRRERLFILETNIDDLSPQVMAYAMEELMAAGGLDVWAVPILMKKGRPGTKINVLCEEEVVDTMIRIILTVSHGARGKKRQLTTPRHDDG